jgi:hypothetical protein
MPSGLRLTRKDQLGPCHRPRNRLIKGSLSSAVADPPDCAVAVFADEKAAVFGDGDSDGPTSDFAIGRDKAGHEIFVLAAWFAGGMIKRHAHDFVAGTLHPVP